MRATLLLTLTLCGAACAPGLGEREPVRVVFFGSDSATLGPPARAVVRDAAAVALARPGAPVSVLGASSAMGAPRLEEAIAARRARAVVDALARAGVPRERIALQTRPALPFDSVPTESRRVEIRVGSASP